MQQAKSIRFPTYMLAQTLRERLQDSQPRTQDVHLSDSTPKSARAAWFSMASTTTGVCLQATMQLTCSLSTPTAPAYQEHHWPECSQQLSAHNNTVVALFTRFLCPHPKHDNVQGLFVHLCDVKEPCGRRAQLRSVMNTAALTHPNTANQKCTKHRTHPARHQPVIEFFGTSTA
jgi:hypothetical protein